VTAPPTCQPFFLETDTQRLFSIACLPATKAVTRGVLLCPPFAEEMNRSRRTLRLLLTQLAERGLAALLLDPRGTGDSTAEFSAARWSDWLDDLAVGARWLRDRGCRELALVGVRAGALLACDLLRRGDVVATRLVLWQPVLSGKSVVTDLLRARAAAAAAAGGNESAGELRRQLAAGTALETAGYLLTPGLVAALDATLISAPALAPWPDTLWLESGAEPGSALRLPAAQLIDALGQAGARITLVRPADPPFWGTLETSVGTQGVAATAAYLAEAA
jgi:exosortase A-associated hydrolase 2